MREIKVSILNEYNEELVGVETTPSIEKEKYPTVLLVHGFGVTKEEYGMFDNLAKNLSESGFLVYRFDFSGCGESEGDYSEIYVNIEDFKKMSGVDFVEDEHKKLFDNLLWDSPLNGNLELSFSYCINAVNHKCILEYENSYEFLKNEYELDVDCEVIINAIENKTNSKC